jgi:hypothetical protein
MKHEYPLGRRNTCAHAQSLPATFARRQRTQANTAMQPLVLLAAWRQLYWPKTSTQPAPMTCNCRAMHSRNKVLPGSQCSCRCVR